MFKNSLNSVPLTLLIGVSTPILISCEANKTEPKTVNSPATTLEKANLKPPLDVFSVKKEMIKSSTRFNELLKIPNATTFLSTKIQDWRGEQVGLITLPGYENSQCLTGQAAVLFEGENLLRTEYTNKNAFDGLPSDKDSRLNT